MNKATRFFLPGLLLLLSAVPVLSQSPDIVWSWTVPQLHTNYPAAMKFAPNGDFVVGFNYERGADQDFRGAQAVGRFNPNGVLDWVVFPDVDPAQINEIHDIAVDALGRTWIAGGLNIPAAPDFPYLQKLDADGNVIFERIYPGVTDADIHRVLPLATGGAIVAGSHFGSLGGRDGLGIRIDSGGNLVWFDEFGAENNDTMDDVILFQGGLLFGGGQNFTAQHYDLHFIHTDMDGNVLWDAAPNNGVYDLKGLLALDNGGFAALVSVVNLMWLQWFDSDGVLLSDLQLDIYYAGSEYNSLPFVLMPDGGFLIGGCDSEGSGELLRTNESGETVWDCLFDNEDPDVSQAITDVLLLSGGEIQFCGVKLSPFSTSWLTQLSPEGAPRGSVPRELPPLNLTGEEAGTGVTTTVPAGYELCRVYPNPFNSSAMVTVNLPETARLTVFVYNLAGQRVANLAGGVYSAGQHTWTFDAASRASGLYLVRATVPGHLDDVRKVMLLR